ncbi:MAG: hypothetical protein ACI4EF_10400 [Coprococcus sp.]
MANKEDKNKNADTTDKKSETKEKKSGTGRVIVITAVICVLLVCSICGIIYFGFVYSSSNIADKAASIYATGTGEDLKDIIPPGYVKYCEENLNSMSVAEMQQIHIDDFRGIVYEQIGEIKSIDAERQEILSVSNVGEFADEFAQHGVKGVKKYRCVRMIWHVNGSNGTVDIPAEVYVLKCDDGWFLDYVNITEE